MTAATGHNIREIPLHFRFFLATYAWTSPALVADDNSRFPIPDGTRLDTPRPSAVFIFAIPVCQERPSPAVGARYVTGQLLRDPLPLINFDWPIACCCAQVHRAERVALRYGAFLAVFGGSGSGTAAAVDQRSWIPRPAPRPWHPFRPRCRAAAVLRWGWGLPVVMLMNPLFDGWWSASQYLRNLFLRAALCGRPCGGVPGGDRPGARSGAR